MKKNKKVIQIPQEGEVEIDTNYELFILVVGAVSILGIVFIFLLPLPRNVELIFTWLDDLLCLLFLYDFLQTLIRLPRRWSYFIHMGWMDLLGNIPTFQLLRVLRLARMWRAVMILRRATPAQLLEKYRERRAEAAFLMVSFLAIIVVLYGSAFVYWVESNAPGGNILTGEDALWWAIVTIATIGYGDRYPVTTQGRLAAAVVMVVGIGFFSTFTGYLATAFLSRSGRDPDVRKEDLEALRGEMAALRQLLLEKTGRLPGEQPPQPGPDQAGETGASPAAADTPAEDLG